MAFIRFTLEADPYNQDQVEMFERISKGETITVEIAGYKISMRGSAEMNFEDGELVKINGSLGDILHLASKD